MLSKAEKTTLFIIETVAPVFNKKGYADTSLSDITSATGLTKGAIYGNFSDKEHLALEAFNYNIRKVMKPLAEAINARESPIEKLKTIFKYYSKYYHYTIEFGGCPVLNVGIDANYMNVPLQKRVRQVIQKLINNIEGIIQLGINEGSFKKEIDSMKYAKRIYSMIEGSIFTAMMQNDEKHIKDMMTYLDEMTSRELLE